ncbi:MAG: MFS transporter [Alphaproteobacteria bacterium]|nr:MFS transporter [Alphaproteobacteria bacterium]
MPALSPRLLLAAMCLAEVVGMAGFATFAALLPTLLGAWSLTNTEAGWISGVYYAGYVVTVPVLVTLTDRMDARRIFLASMLLTALSVAGFGLLADGFWSATLWRFLQGVGLAGTYMPGLKALTDRLPEPLHSRAIAFYTAIFSVGASLSFLLTGELEPVLDWRSIFVAVALGPLAALALGAVALRPAPVTWSVPETALLDFRPVFANRRAMAYTLAYAVHNAELFALKTWVVAYLIHAEAQQATGALGTGIRATVIATVVSLLGVPGSILGNELAQKLGRPRVLLAAMSLCAVVAVAVGFGGRLPYGFVIALVLLYGFMVSADSATITTGLVASAHPSLRGMTMAVHSMIGFMGATLGPLIFGAVLDIGGGEQSSIAWGFAFTAMGALLMLGPVFIYTMGHTAQDR